MANFFNKINDLIFGPEDEAEEEFVGTETEEISQETEFPFVGRRSKVVKINATTQLNVVITQPENFEEAKEIADHLKAKRTVVLNLESMDREVARRVVDFISGAVYAQDGNIQKISTGIFLIAPYNVGIMGNIKDELRNNGLF